MKILHAIYSFNTGGSETMLVDIINQQCKTETVNLLIVNDKLNQSLLEMIDKRVKVFLIGREEGNKLQLLTAFWKINAVLCKIRPDVIHCHDDNLLPFFFTRRKITCLTFHNVNIPYVFLRHFRRVFAISTAVSEYIKKQTGINPTLVYNGIEIENYQQRAGYAFNPKQQSLTIVLLSRLFPQQKGQHIAIKALSLLITKHPQANMTLYFVGDGEASNELQSLALENKVDDKIVFLGQKSRQWIQNHLQDFHLLIQPSLYEGFGLTVIEGFASGLPVIASNIDGPKEIMDILKAGLLVNPGDPADLAEKIYKVYESYVSGNILNSGFLVKDKKQLEVFDIRRTTQNYLKKYESIH